MTLEPLYPGNYKKLLIYTFEILFKVMKISLNFSNLKINKIQPPGLTKWRLDLFLLKI